MGKQLSVIKIRGKVGDVVGMKNGFGTADLAFIRKKADVVTNPQSSAQMLQRVKMLPAVLFRRQLEEVIRRAWQGKKYGGQSMREFMRYAMTEPLENIPQLEKDSVLAIPGEYLIAKGSLAPVQADLQQNGSFALNINGATNATLDYASLSQILIDQAFAKQGDQVSIIVCTRSQGDASAYPRYYIISFYVDVNGVGSILDALTVAKVSMTVSNSTSIVIAATSGNDLLGCAVVISRDGVTPLRSTARFAVNKTLLASYFNSSVLNNVTESYRLSQNIARVNNNDWPYEDTGEDNDNAATDPNRVRVTLGVTPAGAGTVTGAGTYTIGDTVTLNVTSSNTDPSTTYSFVGWKENGNLLSSSRNYSFQIERSMNIIAEFTEEDIPGEDLP